MWPILLKKSKCGHAKNVEKMRSERVLLIEAAITWAGRPLSKSRAAEFRGRGARREAQLMVSEKIDAAFEASASLMAGASGDEIVRRYRRRVAANAKRLGRLNSNRPVLRRARRRRK